MSNNYVAKTVNPLYMGISGTAPEWVQAELTADHIPCIHLTSGHSNQSQQAHTAEHSQLSLLVWI